MYTYREMKELDKEIDCFIRNIYSCLHSGNYENMSLWYKQIKNYEDKVSNIKINYDEAAYCLQGVNFEKLRGVKRTLKLVNKLLEQGNCNK